VAPFFRPPAYDASVDYQVVAPQHCPYSIAAYLRLWEECLTRRARGMFPTDDGDRPWASLDLDERRRAQPRFHVGLRFGSENPWHAASGPLQGLPFTISPVSRRIENGVITSTWGSRNPGTALGSYQSDQYFDYHQNQSEAPRNTSEGGPAWRPPGAPGLLLFHLVKDTEAPNPVVAVGVAIPLGGPDHFAARVRQ
jgi:hypothetical protein